ncbi:uncharacterized protein GGS25DRAFT_509766 [Hypoxylon fragiforme]|uniref:uncharacterized protein n=1 Tax=Hypoxylon fragiforme TaxID=63214 RepID=UPI0020C5F178|nr:uncharacterized protein GGS25DRAFT_509766 [Hypoxylon fragiforme]KAI2603061.1 hypothetical protein GGS25DRAFT_509766 [Hypoxylon fragiforme]
MKFPFSGQIPNYINRDGSPRVARAVARSSSSAQLTHHLLPAWHRHSSKPFRSLACKTTTRHIGTMTNTNPFSTLLGQHDSIAIAKLASLQPAADRDAPIKVVMTNMSLKDTVYECISYDRSLANSANETLVTISVDGEDQAIPSALESALRMFRRKFRPRYLWADLLAGRTPEERSAQASMQRQVLENAERTLCWLGPDNGEKTTRAFQTIHEISRRYSAACQEVGVGPDDAFTRITMQQLMALREKLFDCAFDDLNSFDFSHWNVIYDVFGASYWQSVQSVSDIVLAKAPIVVCGRSNIRWHDYIAASRGMPIFQGKFFRVPLLPHVLKGFEIANSIEIAERRRRLNESVELLPMIQTARECATKDPRETVFSMQLIATPSRRIEFHDQGPQPLPAIDYTKTVPQVFVDAARYSVLERQDLMIWFGERPPCARRLRRHARRGGLPTWVPDYTAEPPKKNMAPFNPNTHMRGWWDHITPASARKPLRVSYPDDDDADDSTSTAARLHLQARPLGRITHVSPIFNGGNLRRLCFSEFQKLILDTSNSPNNYYPNEPLALTKDRFWRTLLLNTSTSHDAAGSLRSFPPPPPSMAAHFESLVADGAQHAGVHAGGAADGGERGADPRERGADGAGAAVRGRGAV